MAMTESDVKAQIRDFITHTLLQNPGLALKDDQSLVDGGLLDSFALLDVTVFLEERFGVSIPDEAMAAEHMDTVNQIAAIVVALQAGSG